MNELNLQADIAERVRAFKAVFAEIMDEDVAEVDVDYLGNAIITVGLDLMMVDLFRRVDNDTLAKAIEQFHAAYPGLPRVKPVEHSENGLVNMHAEFSRRYPKQFFTFVFEKLKTREWAEARERFHRLFREP